MSAGSPTGDVASHSPSPLDRSPTRDSPTSTGSMEGRTSRADSVPSAGPPPDPAGEMDEALRAELAEVEAALPRFLKQSRSDVQNKFVDLEWQQRNRLAHGLRPPMPGADTPSQWARMTGEDVVQRNRYMNVDPFISNRVRLNVPDGASDYINASPIVLETTKSQKDMRWIATQGPKEYSSHHLWRMIADQSDPSSGPAVIVMLTQTHESGREKCFPYFPDSITNPLIQINEHDEFGDGWGGTVRLVNIHEDDVTKSTIRELEFEIVQKSVSAGDPLSDSDDSSEVVSRRTLKVWHLLFAAWPDFLVPEGDDRAALVRLVAMSRLKAHLSQPVQHPLSIDEAAALSPVAARSRMPNFSSSAKSTETKQPTPNPRIVHCSAGVGRSGTFIALDYLLTELEDGGLDHVPDDRDPIADVVDRMRQQRMMMVQGEAQFAFLYAVIRELWIERWRRAHGKGRQASVGSLGASLADGLGGIGLVSPGGFDSDGAGDEGEAALEKRMGEYRALLEEEMRGNAEKM